MPFLRFTRDKRGYETTALVHASRRHGRARQRILYWFRTPPGVKVGRPALDEEAIRWIEEHNPDIEFNWQKILEAQPAPAAPPAENEKGRRPRRDKGDRRRQPRPAGAPGASGAIGAPGLPATLRPETGAAGTQGTAAPSDVAEILEREPVELNIAEVEPEEVELPAIEDALEQLTHPEAEEQIPPAGTPVEKWIAREQLVRLRARHAELQARITERGGDPARIEVLRAQAESLNPDAWVTEEEARKGIEEFEPRIRDLRAALGLRRRRRSRRGGRRRRGGGPPFDKAQGAPSVSRGAGSAGPTPAAAAAETSNEGTKGTE